jgi:hypothetical protein
MLIIQYFMIFDFILLVACKWDFVDRFEKTSTLSGSEETK